MGTFPTVTAATASQVVTAAYFNTYKTYLDFLASPPRCYAFFSGALSPATATATVVPMASEVMDIVQSGDPGMHDLVTNNSRIVARTAGKYDISGQIEFAANATGARSIIVRLNAAGSNASGTLLYQSIQGAVSGNATTVQISKFPVALNAGDYIEMFAYQTSGAALAIDAGQAQTFLYLSLAGS